MTFPNGAHVEEVEIDRDTGEVDLARYTAVDDYGVVVFDFRYNQRVALGISDPQRTEAALRGIVGKRLTYRVS